MFERGAIEKGLAAGEGVEPSISTFRVWRVAVYAIPQEMMEKYLVDLERLELSTVANRATALPVYKTGSLPIKLHVHLRNLIAAERVELSSLAYQANALPLSYTAKTFLVGRVGFEPTILRLKGGCLEPLGYRPACGNWLWRKDSNLR